jgi:succinate dehydrogenase/fumarate reductase flavoprotein subunit
MSALADFEADFEEADIVVVGFGGAGAACAIAAADHGASVVVLEKQPEDRHTPSTFMSGGIVMAVNDVDRAATYMDRCSGGMIPYPVSRAWATMAADLVGWLDRIGADLALVKVGEGENTQFEGAESVEAWTQSRPPEDFDPAVRDLSAPTTVGAMASGMNTGEAGRRTGAEYFDSLRRVVASRERIAVRYASPAVRLIQDETGRVTGVLVGAAGASGAAGAAGASGASGARREVRARRGVVLTCGGYEWNDEIKINALKASPIYFYGNPGNTGDGIRMAQAVGADLWHMNQMIGRAIGHFSEEGREYNFVIGIHPPGYLITDKYGQRFANEVSQAQMKHSFYYELLKYDADKHEYPRNPCYWIFDERRLNAAPLVSLRSGFVRAGYYDWSPDNSREVAKGWIKQADTVGELGKLAGIVDPDALSETVARYNAGCAAGVDEFGRPFDTLVPLDSPPYYCVAMYPGGSNTCGGPRRDERARVLDAFGEPIAGLYAAGELGEAVGLLYPANGANLSESICFGRIAAADALGVSALPALPGLPGLPG